MRGKEVGGASRRRIGAGAALASAALASSALTFACQEPPRLLEGEWVSIGANPAMTYIFDGGGRTTWILDLPQGPDTLVLDYRVDYSAAPLHVDVGPWSTGPVAGRTLFGIAQMNGPDRFVVDFEPGDPVGGADVRPTEFSSQAVTFVRRRN